jgi:hypothetical protein
MKKLLALVALATAMFVGNAARAATVDILVVQQSAGSSLWDLTVNSGIPIGAVAIYVTSPIASLVTNPANSAISSADSGFINNPLEDGRNFLSINNTAIGVNIGSGLYATLDLGSGPTQAGPGDDWYGATVYGADGAPSSADYSIATVPFPTTPEPASVILVGMGLAGVALVRRRTA